MSIVVEGFETLIRLRESDHKPKEAQMETEELSKALSIDFNDHGIKKFRVVEGGNQMKLNSNLGTTMKLLDLNKVD